MKIKRFFAPDMRRALAQVRSEHGPDAVILSSASVKGGVEVVSALDYDTDLISGLAGEGPETAVAEVAEQPAAAAPRPAIEWSQDPTLQAIRGEVESLKQMLREQFAHLAWADLNTFQPERALLRRRAAALGLDDELIETLVEEAYMAGDAAASWRELVRGLAGRIRLAEEDPVEQGGVIALVGPTGVGKTTTIAKLAARHCLRHGADSIALISTDNYRVGAQRQLDAFGAILGVPVRRADSSAALGRLLHEQRERRLVLIDTAGLGPRDDRVTDALHTFAEFPQVQRYLVLPANLQSSAMTASLEAFGAAPLAGITLTKIDEAAGLGAALSVLVRQDAPVAWLGTGQRVPEDLKMARLPDLVGWIARPPAPSRSPAALRPRTVEREECVHVSA